MDKKHWNNLVKDQGPTFGGFLQSWEWGEFQRSLGRKVERISENGLVAQAVQMPLPFGQYYWYTPKGPLGSVAEQEMVAILRDHLSGAMFLRLEPDKRFQLMQIKDVQPSTTLMLDLSVSEEDIFANMKSKTRYNVRLARRKGVETRIVDLDHFNDFVRLLDQTTKRDAFVGHPVQYYRAMLEAMKGGEAKAFLAMGFFEGRAIAANIMIDFNGVRTYLHGTSSNLHRNVMAPYALHAFLIEDAIKKGFKKFDFWGIAPEDATEDHPWKGITRYKKGFGGKVVVMPGTFDLPTKHLWYGAYRFGKKIRSIRS
jgi:peptidoglycan pentaglycine glycine transferase (the first glycine)